MILRIIIIAAMALSISCQSNSQAALSNHKPTKMESTQRENPHYSKTDTAKVKLSEQEWREILSPEVYHIARQKGTERPWTSKFEHFNEIGSYYCKACGNPLFKSDTKFDSGCGWPSFFEPVSKGAMKYVPDHSHGMVRTEVTCGRCDAHLGHVFEDGPPPTGLRYCINGAVLDFENSKG